jgi:tRNA (guanine37-N1)-methyltransferase
MSLAWKDAFSSSKYLCGIACAPASIGKVLAFLAALPHASVVSLPRRLHVLVPTEEQRALIEKVATKEVEGALTPPLASSLDAMRLVMLSPFHSEAVQKSMAGDAAAWLSAGALVSSCEAASERLDPADVAAAVEEDAPQIAPARKRRKAARTTGSMLGDSTMLCVMPRVSVAYDYHDYSASQILRKLLPDDVEVPGAYETAGHLIHLNLTPEQVPHKEIIGSVMLAKLAPRIRTVLNKTGVLQEPFRTMPYEILAGDHDLEVVVNECGCTFSFDFGQVYWNSRLGAEHERRVKEMTRDDTLFDMMAGVGPFAVPAAKAKVTVFANDMNPASHAGMVANAARNKVTLAGTYNLDARAFLHKVREEGHLNRNAAGSRGRQHFTMNLPGSATEFVNEFRGLWPSSYVPNKPPLVHCYAFSSAPDPSQDVIDRIVEGLGLSSSTELVYTMTHVRDIGKNTEMMCASFEVPAKVGGFSEK